MTREAMQQALDALTMPCDRWNSGQTKIVNDAVTALREALAPPSEPIPVRASDIPVSGSVVFDAEMREWAQARGMHLHFSVGSWHVMIGRTWCTTGYDTPQKALEACWESGEYEDIEKCGVALAQPSPTLTHKELLIAVVEVANSFGSSGQVFRSALLTKLGIK